MKAKLLLAAILLFGCSDDTSPPRDSSTPDGVILDSSALDSAPDGVTGDQAITLDMGVDLAPDAGSGCTKISSWPGINPTGGYDNMPSLSYVESAQAAGSPYTMLRVEDFHFSAAPKVVQVDSTWRTIDCDVCAFIAEGCTGSFASCSNVFFVQSGTITITQADAQASGRMIASVSQLKLVAWDEMNDLPQSGGGCYEVDSASFDVTW